MANGRRNFTIHHIFIISAICILQTNCNATDVNICLADASTECSPLVKGSDDYKSCIELNLDQCFSGLCHDRSFTICNSVPSCMINYKKQCIIKLKAWHTRKTSCETSSLSQCQSKLPDLDEFAKCWEQDTQSCVNGVTGLGGPGHRATFGDCEEVIEQEQLCFDIEGSQQCTNVSYTVLVCYY